MEPKNAAEEFFDYLTQKNIKLRNLEEKVYAWSSDEALDFISNAYERLTLLDEPTNSTFSFSASASLSGEPFPCAGINCRIGKLDSLARFATLYSDKVYVTNPFEKYIYSSGIDDRDKDDLFGDILGLLITKPLFQSGIFGVRNNLAACTCKDCLRKMGVIDSHLESRLEKAEIKIAQAYLSQIKVEMDYSDDEPSVRISGPEFLIEHGELVFSGKAINKVLEKTEKSGHKRLSKKDIKESGLLNILVSDVLEDLFQQNVHVRHYHTHYITDRSAELDAAASIDAPITRNASNALLQGLQHSIPTVMNVRLKKLIELREKEGEAFEVYRDNINQVLKQASGLSPNEIEELVADTVRPAINIIDHKLKSSRKLLVGSLKRDMLISAGYVGIGIFAGFISKDAGTVLASVGGLNFLKESATAFSQMRGASEAILENPYYFLWKLKGIKSEV